MRSAIIAAIIAASAAPAFAANVRVEHVPIKPPPPKYARGAYLVAPVVHLVDDVDATCQALAPQPIPYSGCSVAKTGDVYLPPNDKSDWWQELRAHELAHLRGWSADHRH